jgi:alkanesulfonate monooxygenase SsuD/methylene tetrahydromethanopterin reductase-like flavin-dependent oxidoreductase (luciferase family)
MFNIVPQWNPLRLAEDFAAADILTKGRMRFGVGRGTVPREMQSLGAQIEGTDNAMSVDAEARNREAFEEAMAVIKLAWTEESFSFSGKHFVLPPPGIPDRNTTVTDLTLVPTVLRDVEVYQACTSPRTVEYVAEQGHIGVYQRIPIKDLRAKMQHQVEVAQRCGRNVEIGDEQMLVVGAVVADTRKEAVALARPHHDEMVKLLAPYGRFSNYEPPAGMDSVPVTYAPTLEESMRQRFYAVGTSEDVADVIAGLRDELSLKRISVSLDGLDLTNDQMAEQYRRFGAEVAPLLGEKMVPETQAFPSGSDHGE